MKRFVYSFMLLVLLIVMIPVVFAKDEVSIETYKLVSNSENATEVNKPKTDGLKISFDLGFSKKGDSIKYQIVINNPTKKDYEINKDASSNNSKYITYSYEFDDNNVVVKANSKMTMYIIITYSEEVPVSELKDGKYTEDKTFTISLLNNENPETSINISIASIIILAVVGILLTLYIKTKKKAYLSIMLALLLIPATIIAAEKLQISISTRITIEENYKVVYSYQTMVKMSEKATKCQEVTISEGKKVALTPTVYDIDGVEYTRCYTTKEKTYSAGSRVQLEKIPFVYINPDDNCTINDDNNKYICESDALEDHKYILYRYSKYNLYYQEDDLSVMNFKNPINDHLEDDGYFETEEPNEFTMPKHDVYFNGYFRKLT